MTGATSSLVPAAMAAVIPLLLLVGAAFVSTRNPLQRATRITTVALALSVSAVAAGWLSLVFGAHATPDTVTSVMLVLVCAIGAAIARYSQPYLDGEPGQVRYARWLQATLAAVTTLVLANHLLVFAAAWAATSVALHQLLTHYSDRPRALVAAHKKFLVSRLAELALLGAIGLVYTTTGTARFDALGHWIAAHPTLPPALHLAAVLFVVAASLKSAQLPFHGWLTQVMEAPTPVSALLHAGVVNIGGFMMIRLADLMAHAPAAQALLVVIGTTTAVLSTLVMSTRVSIKVALAWSTCAQMGFMLVQCGLGAWSLALLHLVAHSLYKAHAFLSTGRTVEHWRTRTWLPARPQPSVWRPLLTLGGLLAAVLLVAAVWAPARETLITQRPALAPLTLVFALALVPLITRLPGHTNGLAAGLLRIAGVIAIYAGWHMVARAMYVDPVMPAAYTVMPWVVAAAFLLLFVVQAVVEARPQGRWAQGIYPWLFAGLHLDEWFTRVTFRLWPPHLTPRPVSEPAILLTQTSEGRP